MAFTLPLIGDLADLGLNDFQIGPGNARKIRGYVRTNLGAADALIDTTNQVTLLGDTPITILSNGTWSVDLLDTSSTDLNVEANTLQYELVVEYTSTGSPAKRVYRSGWFALTEADLELVDDVPMAVFSSLDLDLPSVTPSWRSAFRDEMEALRDETAEISGLTDVAGAMTVTDADAGSPFRVQQDARLATTIATEVAAASLAQGQGRRLISALMQGRDAVLAFAGDSLGTSANEYPYLLSTWLGEQFPSVKVNFYNHDFTGGGYQPVEVIQPGTPAVSGGTIVETGRVTSVEDDFTYTAAEVYGQTPSVSGAAWDYNGTAALGDWSAAGAGAVSNGHGTVGYLLNHSNAGSASTNADHFIDATIVPAAANPGAGLFRRIDLLAKYVSTSAMLRVKFQQHDDGDVTLFIEQVIGGTITVLDQTAKFTPGASISVQAHFGPKTFVLIDGTRELVADLDPALFQSGGALYSPTGTKVGFRGLSDSAGVKVTHYEAGRVDPLVTKTLTVYNGCRAGSTFAYQATNKAVLYPVEPDVMFCTSQHNYGSDTDAYLVAVQSFFDSMKATYPDTEYVFGSENPELSPIAQLNRTYHANRCFGIAWWAARHGCGYVPGFETFSRYDLAYLIDSDGVHPLETIPGGSPYTFTGAELFAQCFINHLDRFVDELTVPEPA